LFQLKTWVTLPRSVGSNVVETFESAILYLNATLIVRKDKLTSGAPPSWASKKAAPP